MKLRNKFVKEGDLRFISHLDIMRVFERTMRRASIKFSLSKGYNPHPLISFGPALMLGATTHGDYFDVIIDGNISTDYFKNTMNKLLPSGICIKESSVVDEDDLLSKRIKLAEYIIKVEIPLSPLATKSSIEDFMSQNEIIIEKESKSGKKSINLRPYIIEFNYMSNDNDYKILYTKLIINEGSPGPIHLVDAFLKFNKIAIKDPEIYIDRRSLLFN